ncbi:MAG: DUF1552 domain-containing protein [Deltaproteobacteria bacterium]
MLRGLLATGAAMAVPLPVLDGMLNGNGTAFAQGQPLVRRFATWFFGNGILPPRWNPTATGNNWELSDQLAPLANVKEYLTVVSGLVNKFPGSSFHPLGSAASTTGGGVEDNSAVVPSIDQLVAEAIGRSSLFKSVELGVSDATPNGPENTLHAVSHRGKNAPNFPEFDPLAVFSRLFAQAEVGAADITRLNQAKQSILDAVVADANEMRGLLGTVDRQRLEQHLDGIRQLETRLATPSQCVAPPNPATVGVTRDTRSEAPQAVSGMVSELLALAFACDLTRAASVVFTLPAAHVYYRHLGADMNDDFHDTICHTDPGDSTSQIRVHRGVIFTMQCLSVLLQRLRSLPEGDGTVLDNSLIYVTSCTSWGKVHAKDEWPVLLAGKAGGALPGNVHYRAPGENLSKMLFTIANLMGANVTSLGAREGLVESGLSGFV